MSTRYDDSNINSIIEYSKQLIGKTFYDVINEAVIDEEQKRILIDNYNRPNYKGGLGILLEELYFGYKANNNQMPDFDKVGMELKSTPYEKKEMEVYVLENDYQLQWFLMIGQLKQTFITQTYGIKSSCYY